MAHGPLMSWFPWQRLLPVLRPWKVSLLISPFPGLPKVASWRWGCGVCQSGWCMGPFMLGRNLVQRRWEVKEEGEEGIH